MSDENNRNLECPICHEIFKDPKMLPCGHSFCGECLTRMTQGQNVRQVTCPTCREVADIPRNGFSTNYALYGVVEDAADAARKLNEEVRKNTATSAKEFQENVSSICQQLNEKLTKWNKISELLNAMVAKSFEMTESTQSMDMDYCQKSMKDIEEMKEIVTDIATNFDLAIATNLDETRILTTLRANRDNILIKDTFSQLEALAENFSTVSLEQDQIGTSSEPTGINEENVGSGVLIIGGDTEKNNDRSNSLELYNPYSNTDINQLLQSELQIGRIGHVAAVIDGTIYVVGGRKAKKTFNSMELFAVDQDHTYQRLGFGRPMIQQRSSFASVVMEDKLLVFGGLGGVGGCYHIINSCEYFDPIIKTWYSLPTMEKARADSCAVEFDGQAYIIGGTIGCKSTPSLSLFNPYKSSWISATPMKQGRQWAGAGKLGSEIVVTGGCDDDITLNSCEMLDPRKNKWMDIAPMQRKRRDHVLINCDGKLLAIGGCQSRNTRWSCVEKYDQRANKWRFEKSLIIERADFAAVTVP